MNSMNYRTQRDSQRLLVVPKESQGLLATSKESEGHLVAPKKILELPKFFLEKLRQSL